MLYLGTQVTKQETLQQHFCQTYKKILKFKFLILRWSIPMLKGVSDRLTDNVI